MFSENGGRNGVDERMKERAIKHVAREVIHIERENRRDLDSLV